jgi:hypothetical protein
MRTILFASCFAIAISAAAPLEAQADAPRTATAARPWQRAAPLVSVSLVDHEGMALPSAMHHGQTFVAGEHGQRYAIALTNNTAQRVEVVVTVDGRDVVSGKRGDVRTQRGYVLMPFQSIEIEGFRQSLSRVAAFRFADVAESYAARRGNGRDAGVIGVAVFQEKRRPMVMKKRAPPTAAPSASRDAERSRQDLGTEYGESRASVVRQVAFERMTPTRPDFRTALFYDSAHALADRGIPIEGEALEVVDGGFAPPPPRRR